MRRRPNDREAILDAAVRDGKIEASRRAEYARRYDANPSVIRNLLTAPIEQGGLMPGLVRLDAGAAEDPGYDPNWLTASERQRLAEVRSAAPGAPPLRHRLLRRPWRTRRRPQRPMTATTTTRRG